MVDADSRAHHCVTTCAWNMVSVFFLQAGACALPAVARANFDILLLLRVYASYGNGWCVCRLLQTMISSLFKQRMVIHFSVCLLVCLLEISLAACVAYSLRPNASGPLASLGRLLGRYKIQRPEKSVPSWSDFVRAAIFNIFAQVGRALFVWVNLKL